MKTYTVYVHDRRYSVPNLLTVELAHDDRAAAFAEERLQSSAFYFGVEVWDGDVQLCNLVDATVLPVDQQNSGKAA